VVDANEATQKFQDLEEERIDFTKSSLWTFANVSSTVCVSDDAVSSLESGPKTPLIVIIVLRNGPLDVGGL
jgi:hypothetical protein